ncbi:MAG: DUF6029 family protein [Bacteroidales bacterium]|nr:DUF6029 family protein [Bacteroidales bacterium]
MRYLLFFIVFAFVSECLAQKTFRFSGQFESNSQYYINEIAENIRDKQIASNNYLDLLLGYGKFEAGISAESYLPNPLLGYPIAYDKTGISKFFVRYASDKFNLTLGDFYEQLGSGLIYRSYQQREIGVDQSSFGANLHFLPTDFLRFKLIYGTPNFYFAKLDTRFYGFDSELDFQLSSASFTLGFSALLKQEKFTDKQTVQHNNSKLYSTRLSGSIKNFDIKTEYAFKTPDANVENNYNTKKGQALQISPSYSKRGFGINLNFRAILNMSVLNERELDANGNGRRDEDILNYKLNYIPSISQIHSYNIYNIYTYQAKENNEIGYSASVYYKIKRKTALGGKYGTKIRVSSSVFYTQTKIDRYTDFLKLNEKLFNEHGIEIDKKINKKFKLITQYTYQEYNKFLVEDNLENREIVYSHILVGDLLTKFNRQHSLRTELGFMFNKNDLGNWGTILLEYANSKGWSVFVSDQYNFGTEKKHYYLIGSAYSYKNARIAITYGETRDGYTCVGGICKFLPGAEALSLSLAFKF